MRLRLFTFYSFYGQKTGKKWVKETGIVEKYAISTATFSKMWIKVYNISHNRVKFVKKPVKKDKTNIKLWINPLIFTQTYLRAV